MPKRSIDGLPLSEEFQQYPCTREDFYVLVIGVGKRVNFHGWCGVHCLGGDVRIDGFHLRSSSWKNEKENMVMVCAPFVEGKPAVFEALTVVDDLSLSHKPSRLKYRLKEVTNQYEKIMATWGARSPTVLLINRRPNAIIDSVEHMYGNIFSAGGYEQRCYFDRTSFFPNNGWMPYTPESLTELESNLELIESKRREGERCTIMPLGRKSAGKSTFLRILANRLLNPDLPPVYLLDCDVGQSEFTPAGCISLWKLDCPLLGQPWSHQNINFTSSYFFGDVQVADDKRTYENIFDRLLNEFNAKSEPGSILLINTLGWLEGTGAEIMRHITAMAHPDFIFYISTNLAVREDPRTFPIVLHQGLKFITMYRARMVRKSERKLSAAELRDLRMLGYFSKQLSPVVATPTQSNIFKIAFSDAILTTSVDAAAINDAFFIGSFNSQVVALCSPSETLDCRRLLDKPYLPSITLTKPGSPLLHCHGFALVRAVDLTKRRFLLMSPIPPDLLSRVTVIARGLHNPVPPVMLRSPNGQPALYSTSPTEQRGASTASDLYVSLKTNAQTTKYHRVHYPGR